MFKFAAPFILPAVLSVAGTAEAQTKHVVQSDGPAALYLKCTSVGSDEHDSAQCRAFREAADQEIAACMSKGAAQSQGYRALHLRCVQQQALRFTNASD